MGAGRPVLENFGGERVAVELLTGVALLQLDLERGRERGLLARVADSHEKLVCSK